MGTSPPLHTYEVLPHTTLNHVFATVYSFGLLALFYHHIHTLFSSSTTFFSFLLHLSLIVADFGLAFMWACTQGFRLRHIKRTAYPENLHSVAKESEYPAMDVFICTADPYKEPPVGVVNTALSVMAYEYPTEKITVYISDDGGSKLTLFAFMEAAKFAVHWLPFCRENNIMERSPEVYFQSNNVDNSFETQKIKMMYETMKVKVESVVERGIIPDEHMTSEEEGRVFAKWTADFTRQNHPSVIHVLLESGKDRDITGHEMPNLVYVSREKRKNVPHKYKGGALNVLLRVSAAMTNSPIILTLDCDMYSNDPRTPLRSLCYFLDPNWGKPELAYIQYPQRFHNINKDDTYGGEHKRLLRMHKAGMDGFRGPHYCGTGCFFRRRAFYGPPSEKVASDIPEMDPDYVVEKSIRSEEVLTLAQDVAGCNYEDGTNWGNKIGIRYGSLVEDLYTGYRMLCEGWRSIFSDPERAAFLGDVPITLEGNLSQERRWALGTLEIGLSKYCPTTFGLKHMGLPMALCFSHHAFWASWSIPVTIYAFIPPLALLNRVYIFPQVSSPWFYLYTFLVVAAYGQDFFDFMYHKGTITRWYNDQRTWMIRGVTSYLFTCVDRLIAMLGISAFGFNVTSKAIDDEQSKRYDQGLWEFGVASPMFVPLTTAAILHLIAFVVGLGEILRHGNWDEMLVPLSLSGFVMVNSWPIYEAIVLRADKGRMPASITLVSIFLAWVSYLVAFVAFKMS